MTILLAGQELQYEEIDQTTGRNSLLSSEPFNSTRTLSVGKSNCLIIGLNGVRVKKRVITQVCGKLFSWQFYIRFLNVLGGDLGPSI